MKGLKVWLRLHFGVSGSVVVESVRLSDARFDIRLTVKKKDISEVEASWYQWGQAHRSARR